MKRRKQNMTNLRTINQKKVTEVSSVSKVTITHCWVVNENMDIEILHGDLVHLLSKEPKGEITHVLVGFREDWMSDKRFLRVYPINRIFFGELPKIEGL